MGMSIDEVITALERDIHNAKLCGHQIDQYKVAIDTMRKYQQIQEIVNHWNNTGGSAEESDILDYIEEVLKDGKID